MINEATNLVMEINEFPISAAIITFFDPDAIGKYRIFLAGHKGRKQLNIDICSRKFIDNNVLYYE